MPTLKIDDQEITVEPGTSVLKAAAKLGIEIPHYCYHPALSIAGSCRMCLVEIEGHRKLEISCATTAADGMAVHTDTPAVKKARKDILEFLLINHPLDCPVCDKAGECDLQDYDYKYGSSHSRFPKEDKRVRPTKAFGGNIRYVTNRCILCTRCVRFYKDVVGEEVLFVENRGYRSEISVFPGKELGDKLDGSITEICPVGALLDEDFIYQARVWHLDHAKSVCPGCSAGCNIDIQTQHNKIYRIRSRENQAVNQHWICDDGRYIFHKFEDLERIESPLKRAGEKLNPTNWEEALSIIHDRVVLIKKSDGAKVIGAVGSVFASNEENYLLKKLFKEEIGTDRLYVYTGLFDGEDVTYKNGFTIRAEKAPNRRGAEIIFGKIKSDLWKTIDKGEIKALYYINADKDFKLTDAQKNILKKLEFLAVQDFFLSDIAKLANVVLPGSYFAEKTGTFTNVQGCTQRFTKALKLPGLAKEDWAILVDLGRRFNSEWKMLSASDVMNDLA
ncbi:MAG TPA: 2Fe-2S iron-sulfur cluster binding domain-containing protein, partial [Bacteroidetes bacterium]|nr:2Fe-2S iron-sulfur cluster binding domain-containing protein [Bacteroidota bacterium]